MNSRGPIKTYRDLLVWQKAIKFVTKIYRLTQKFTTEEQYGLTFQLRKSAVSIPSNIAEGFGRNHKREYKRYLEISMGSLYEAQTQLIISHNLEYITTGEFEECWNDSREIERMLSSLINKLS